LKAKNMLASTEELKRQAKVLVGALRNSGAAQLSPAQALDAVARMHGKSSWQAVIKAGGVGFWSAEQLAIHRAYPRPPRVVEGKSFVGTGDLLYEALMHLANSQPGSRLRKTLAHWADEADHLQQAVRDSMLIDEPYAPGALELPKGLAGTFARFMKAEFDPELLCGWADAGARLEALRRSLYVVQEALMPSSNGSPAPALMLLESLHGTPLPVGVPVGMTSDTAYALAEQVIGTLHARAVEVQDGLFAFEEAELKVRLAQAGFSVMASTVSGPIWD
jgi:hypothetical protein